MEIIRTVTKAGIKYLSGPVSFFLKAMFINLLQVFQYFFQNKFSKSFIYARYFYHFLKSTVKTPDFFSVFLRMAMSIFTRYYRVNYAASKIKGNLVQFIGYLVFERKLKIFF